MAENKLLDVEIITPQKVLFSGKAYSVSVPGGLAPFQVLVNHAPIVSTLEPGVIKIEDEKHNLSYYNASEGFIEVRQNKASILVESAAS